MSRRFFCWPYLWLCIFFSQMWNRSCFAQVSCVCPLPQVFLLILPISGLRHWRTHSLPFLLSTLSYPPLYLMRILSLSLRCDQPQSTVEKQKAKTNMKSLKSLYNSIRSDSPFRNSGESARNSPRNSTRNQNVELAIISTFTPLPTIKFWFNFFHTKKTLSISIFELWLI